MTRHRFSPRSLSVSPKPCLVTPGAILIGSLFNGLNIVGVGYEWQLVAIGLVIVTAVVIDNLSRR